MLKGDNVILRALKLSDWEKTIEWRNDFENKKLAMMHPYPVTEFLEQEWYAELLKNKSNKVVYFAITDINDCNLGYIFLTNINHIHRNCHLGIIVGSSANRNKGIGYEAIRLISDYAFNTLNMIKITVEVICHNDKAIKLYERLGFVKEGCMRMHFFSNGTHNDVLIMSLFKTGDK